ncbi:MULTISPECIES: carbohydrate kinase family protein [Prauserella salsuginis group]|uniref:Adenosine kinase n=2 Tax=Prauserella salsuginis group TaxID=2893672 RepID=A0A839XSJ6_9PSEU|nr:MULTISPECIES: carbohydrate kinase family protein [Prauserella salsuginis group]MBB3664414.1 adenosine kinase [Prauserella sediminis]MCR3721866.1 adenosine kinase [Prauserella flava]MCR3735871.1 adenosine kinase [Prauserella salsuginis]
MRIAVIGSIATDHLMSFSGKIKDQLVADSLENVSLSFLVEHLDVRRGGVAGNISLGLGRLGLNPVLVGAVGQDFGEYRSFLEKQGVDTKSVHVSETQHTSRFLCTTDEEENQIASFYAGAMSEMRDVDLTSVTDRVGELDMALIGANDPEAMLRHTEQCRQQGIPFAADISQQLAIMSGDDVRKLVDGATYLFTNEYEATLLLKNTGWSEAEVLDRVGSWVTTLGGDGVRISGKSHETIEIPSVPDVKVAEPTGVGDAFRAGFLWALSVNMTMERAAQVGCVFASIVLEAVGPQEYTLDRSEFSNRVAKAYGNDAAAEIESKLRV